MKILVLVNWRVNSLSEDSSDFQPPDKLFPGGKYWFFKHLKNKIDVDVIDYTKILPLFYLEKRLLKFYVCQSVRALYRMKNYDLVISHGAQSGLVLALLRAIIGSKFPPHILIDVGCFNGGRDDRLELLPIRMAAKSLRGVIFHASIQEKYYHKYLPSLKRKFIPFGVDTDLFRPTQSPSGNYILAPGYAKRDYGTLLSAWAKMDRGNTKLKIVGLSHIKSGGESLQGVELVNRLPISEFATMVAKALFVVIPLPVFNYAYGQMTMLQAMAMKKAVIVTRTPSTVDYLSDKENGLFVRPYDPIDLADKMQLLSNDPNLALTLGRNARASVEGQFSEKAMANNIFDFIREILG